MVHASWMRRVRLATHATRRTRAHYTESRLSLSRLDASAAFTAWHAADLAERLEKKCADGTERDQQLLRSASAFTLKHADLQRCVVDEVVAEQANKTFLTPVGELCFDWVSAHSMMPMELPLRWRCDLSLVAGPESARRLLAGEMRPDARGPPKATSAEPDELAALLDAMAVAAGGPMQRRDLQWLLAFLCGEPSDFAFDALSGTLEAVAADKR